MKKHSNPKKNNASLREKIIGLGERSIQKSYYPQLKKQLEKLKESEKRFRELAELLPQVVFEIDEKGNLLFVNHYAFDAFGYTQGEFDKGLNAFQMFIPEDRERMEKDILRILNGEYIGGIEYSVLRKDGNKFPVIGFASPIIRKNKPVGLRGILIDITERKLSERELQRSSDLLRAIIEAAPVAIIGLDLDGNVHTVWNPAAEKMLGWSAQEIMGRPLPSVSLENREEFKRFRERISRGETLDGVEVRRQRRDGKPIDYSIYASPLYDVEGRIIGNIAVLMDITERKRVENIMQARLRLLEFANSHSMDEFLTATLDEIEALTGSAIGFYHFLESDQKTLLLQNWSTNTLKNMCTASGKGGHYDIAQAGVWVDCVYERRPIIHKDYASLPHRKGMPEGHAPVVREVVVPIFRGDLIKAIIGIGNKSTDYDESDIEIVSQLGDLSWDIVERKCAEEALQESEERFRSIFDIAGEGILIADTDDKKFYMGNNTICQMLGYKPEEIGNLNVEDIHPKEQLSYVLEQFEKQARGEIVLAMDIPVKRKDGSVFYADVRSSHITLHGKTYLMGVFSDITERRRTEEALHDAAQQWQTTFDAMNECIFLLDSSFKILRCNKASSNLLGKSPKELVGHMCWEVVHGTSAPVDWCPFARMQKTIRKESSIVQMGERWIEVYVNPLMDDKGDLIGAVHVIADITERKRAEDALRLSEAEQHDAYFAQSAINIILSESLKDIPLELILQKALNIMLAVPWLSFEPTGSIHIVENEPGVLVMKAQSNLTEQLKKLCSKVPFGTCLCGSAALTGEIQFADHIDERHGICYEGMVPHGHYIVPLLFGGRTIGVIDIYLKEGHIRDEREEEFLRTVADTLAGIIVRKQGEDEKEKLEAQLMQAQKLEAVGQLAGGIAHDFNNILTAMIGYGHLLKMKLKEEDPLRTYADQILSLSDKAANLTQSLLSFSRKRIMNPEPVNLNEVIKKIDHLLSRIIGEDIKLQTMLSEEDLIVMADPGQMEQVLMNLATNARDAMPEGGFLTIGTEKIAIDEEFIKEHGFGKEGEYALISVTDTGAGMDRETREKIFEPFFTTKEVGKGTGLGLSMVYGIVKQHDGYINVYSEPGSGTTFRIYLPLIKAKIEKIKPEVIQPVETGTETVLLAEDETEVREFIKKMLEEYGYRVITAGSGQEAIDEFKAHKDKIQLLLLDVIMPNRNGREAYEEIKKIRPDIRVLFMSGYPADIIHKHNIIENGFAYIEKPVSPTKLLRKIKEALGKSTTTPREGGL